MNDATAHSGRGFRWGGDRLRLAIIAIVALFIGLYWVNLFHEMRTAEDEAVEEARRRVVFITQAAAEAVETTLNRFQVTLTTASIAATQGADALRLYGDAVSAGSDELVFQLFRIDAGGTLAYSSLGPAPRNYLGDRWYFRQLAAEPGLPLVVSPPVQGRLTGKLSLQVAKAVVVRGRFAGVVAIAVNPQAWTRQLARFELGSTDVLSLFSADGVYLLRTREPEKHMGQHVAEDRPFLVPGAPESGWYRDSGTHDGIERIFAWKRLSTGQVMAGGVGLDGALAPVRELNHQTSLWAGIATAALALALLVIAVLGRHSDRVARAAAQQQEAQRVTLSAMAEGLAMVAPSGEVLFHNDSFARLIPYDKTRLCRIGGFQAWDVVDETGAPLPLEQFPSVIAARTGRTLDNVSLGLRGSNGSLRWYNVNARPLFGRGGNVQGSILTVGEVTSQRQAERALKASEERYRALVDSLMEGIVVQNRDGIILSCNPAAERIFGAEAGTLIGRSPFDPRWQLIHPDGNPLAHEECPAHVSLRTGARCEGVVMGVRHENGDVTWIEANAAPLGSGEDGLPLSAVSSFLDITHRKEFEDELSRSNAELEQFAYAVSHDLREPLRMVASYIQLLERRLGDAATDDIREFVSFAVDGAKRMDRMLVALLEYSRVGRRGLPMEWVDSRKVLDEALLFLSPVVQQTKAEVRIEGEWPWLLASPDEIERLFQNLLGNALKYHADGVAPVVAARAARDGSGWRFTFADNGIGIAADQTDRLFKVFQRLHRGDRYEGSGVGLALCRRIVQRHEGRIWVESDGPGQGSHFIFTLPAAQAQVPEPAPAETS